MLVVPMGNQIEFQFILFLIERNDDLAEQFLHRADKPFNDGDAPMLTDRPTTGTNVSPLAPRFETGAPKLRAFVAHDVFRFGFRPTDSLVQTRLYVARLPMAKKAGLP